MLFRFLLVNEETHSFHKEIYFMVLRTPYLKPLAPFPRRVDEDGLVGELDVMYNAEDNYMVFSFSYERENHRPAPLVVHVEVSGKRYRHVLFICDFVNRLAKTALFRPEYDIWQGVHLYSISPLLSYAEKLVDDGAFGPDVTDREPGEGKA
jgi:hypothetical protein